MIGLVDCNSFYASCEKLFRPDLYRRPVVVLSNNDGCIVAMSPEAKALGIRRGVPYFQVRSDLQLYDAAVFSSNYALYQSISNRVMDLLEELFPCVEVYSIDEAFVHLPDAGAEAGAAVQQAKKEVDRCVGIPVSIGVGRTKTLAKIANRYAKLSGCFVLHPEMEQEALQSIPVADVWGIGPRKGRFLLRRGIRTAWDLRGASEYWIKKHLTIVTLRTLWELQGKPSVADEVPCSPKKGILSSQGFSSEITRLEDMRQVIAFYAEKTAAKLSAQGSSAGFVTVHIRTHRFKEQKQYVNSMTIRLDPPSRYPPDIIAAAQRGLDRIYREGFAYAKAGVYLTGIDLPESRQLNLFCREDPRKAAVEQAVSDIHGRYGRRSIHTLGSGGTHQWAMRQNLLSPRYTTRWEELPQV